jgi:hypothetical protein
MLNEIIFPLEMGQQGSAVDDLYDGGRVCLIEGYSGISRSS